MSRARLAWTAASALVLLLVGSPDHMHGQAGHPGEEPPAADSASHGEHDRPHHHPAGEPAVTRPMPAEPNSAGEHTMAMEAFGGWRLATMAQLIPMVTVGAPGGGDRPMHDTEFYVTQPAVMANLSSPEGRLVLHATFNFEAWTQPGGEYTFGGWGEGYLDKRHPHTLLHEATLSLNAWDGPWGSASLTAGKGFAAYGTDDPMSRPVVKFPTNHHLSQVLERWLVTGAYQTRSGLSLEASVFGGAEPTDAYDLSNLESFGDSYSARVIQRLGGNEATPPWELSASWAYVEEEHHGTASATRLYNAAIRHAGDYGMGKLYALAELSKSEPDAGEGFWSLLAEGRADFGGHRPYYRIELATRPEYERSGPSGTWQFYRYDHDSPAIGASRWQIHSLGYEDELVSRGVIARPFVEVQYHRVEPERGDVDALEAFGGGRFWSLTAGLKLFLGGDGMRMGRYGVLDPMATAMRGGGHPH